MANVVLPALHDNASLSNLSMSPRSKLATQNIITDAWTDGRGIDHNAVESAIANGPDNSFIDKLWNLPENKDVVDAFMNNKLCRAAAAGDAVALEAYNEYAVQDYFYLLDHIKFKAGRLTTILQSDLTNLNSELESLGQAYGYAQDWKKTCIQELKIDPARFATEERCIAELAYANVLQNDTHSEDWFSLHVIMIGCVYGWSKLAMELYPTADRTTPFFDTWIKDNVAVKDGVLHFSDSAVAQSTFLTENDKTWSSLVETNVEYPRLFRTCMRLETALFDSAYEDVKRKKAGGNL